MPLSQSPMTPGSCHAAENPRRSDDDRIVYANPWFQVVREGRYHWVEEPTAEHGTAVLPLVGDQVLLLERRRPAQRGVTTWEIPRGYAEPGELVLDCARRELAEEAGIDANVTNLREMGRIRPNTAILASCVTLFVATLPADVPRHARDSEAAGLVCVPVSEVPQWLASGRLEDGFTLAALALFMASRAGASIAP